MNTKTGLKKIKDHFIITFIITLKLIQETTSLPCGINLSPTFLQNSTRGRNEESIENLREKQKICDDKVYLQSFSFVFHFSSWRNKKIFNLRRRQQLPFIFSPPPHQKLLMIFFLEFLYVIFFLSFSHTINIFFKCGKISSIIFLFFFHPLFLIVFKTNHIHIINFKDDF